MKKSTILVLLLGLFLTACAQHNGAVVIRTLPEGAEVVDLKSGVVMGVTPLKYWWRDDDSTREFVNIRAHKEGYHDKTNSFWVDLRHKSREEALENAQPVDMIMEKRQ
jgi:hypothetical protein